MTDTEATNHQQPTLSYTGAPLEVIGTYEDEHPPERGAVGARLAPTHQGGASEDVHVTRTGSR